MQSIQEKNFKFFLNYIILYLFAVKSDYMNENEEYEDIPKYEKEEYFIGTFDIPIDKRKEFYDNLSNVLRNIGISYTRNIATKYYKIYLKNKKSYKKTNREFEKLILSLN